jgi:YidC/Oxa1 family membrane protein insertase
MFLLSDARPPLVGADPVVLAGDNDPVPIPRVEVPYSGVLALYVGPQQAGRLSEADEALAAVVDFGFFEILARPFLFGLALIHTYVGNWGWSIIILTIFINFVFFPLRLKQQLSMQKMQTIQPQMRTLQDRYKKLKANDPRRQEVQAEMMGLYKKHGVNPLGGCLPLLLQMPFLIAVFWLLQVAIELRQAPWILWIQDLSSPEPGPIRALPLLFCAAMFLQQKTMPTTMDPTQARIMMLMPLMLGVMFYGSQSGLMLYWVTSTAFGVGQQLLIRKYWGPRETPKRLPKAEEAPPGEPAIEAKVVASDDEGEESEPKRRRRRRKK